MTAQTKQPPVFVVGVHRSGTTLLNLMLDSHSQLWIPYESHFIVRLHRKYVLNGQGDFESPVFRRALVEEILGDHFVKDWEVDVTPDEVDVDACRDLSSAIDAVYSAHAAKAGKTRWGDKTPSYVYHADLLNELFPECKFIHLVRDGRDVARSVVRRHWGPDDLVSALREWARKVEVCDKMLRMLPPGRRSTLRYEDLVEKPGDSLRGLCEFLDLPFEESMLQYQGRSAEKLGQRRSSTYHSGLMGAPSKDFVQQWKREMSPVDQSIAQEVAGEMLDYFGYEPGRRNHPLKAWGRFRHKIDERRSWKTRKGRAQ
ncbi:sulfotransferase family protein [Desulfohalovibrio reitneri]|uniref:sulfotransferase family protein n=1 Tax=Desulfohalovibrio reitneri TaxID=1307759 RepID=UPI0004A72606|nr:sulfotransferase [Desulfohalovibrio reitneri]